MKKISIYALMGAIALTGAVSITSCTSSDDVTNNPNYDPETNTVNTQFVLNIATNSASTRSGATDVQEGASSKFRGMEKVQMFAFATGTKKAVQKDAAFVGQYNLDKLINPEAVTADNSNRIVNINIPVGTDAFLFYGKAMRKTTDTDETVGKIEFDVSTTAESKLQTKFSLQPRATAADLSVLTQTENFVADILNTVCSASQTYTKDGATTTTTMTLASLGATYASEINQTVKSLTPLELSLGEAYYKMTTIGTDELRAGSADAVLNTMSDFKKTLKTVTTATPTGTQEIAAKALAESTNTLLTTYFNYNSDTGVSTFNDVGNLKTTSALTATWSSNTTITNAILGGFPQCFGLPAGCSLLTYDTSTNKFKYKTTAGSNILDQARQSRDKMMYPAELTYYCNGPIRTANTDKQTGGYPNGTQNWATDAQWAAKGDWTTGPAAVTSSTLAAALIPNVNYGVAMLESDVQLASDVANFKDNRHANTGETDNEIPKSNINLTFTGIIVCGQCPQVGWDFLRRQTSDGFDYMVYDNRIAGESTGTAVPTSGKSAANYTLLFDNYKCGETIATAGTQTGQDDVNVALEFVNNGDDFWGQGNLIRKGTTFYLTAKLTKPSASTDITWPGTTDGDVNRFYEVPPIDASGNSLKIARVFVQDYKTTATFTIGAESLKKALVTVPDLRSTQMSFGLSVDLTWKQGLSYSNVPLGQ